MSTDLMCEPAEILAFWFADSTRPRWFRATPEFDAELTRRFLGVFEAAERGDLAHWRDRAEGALALVIALDQFPLNMFRGRPRSFSTEAAARAVAAHAIEAGFDADYTDAQKMFLYMPYMHSESLLDQDRALALFAAAGMQDNLKWAHHHREIVRRFGRFPHRNAILGRPVTAEEEAYLASDEAFKG